MLSAHRFGLVMVVMAGGVAAHPVVDDWRRLTGVADRGETRLVGADATATLTTRFATPAEVAPDSITRCSGGRTQYSLIDRITIRVGGRDVAVPQRAAVLLADVNRGGLRRLPGRRYELYLECGDAASSYHAKLYFDRTRVDRMELWAAEAGRIEQVTTFKDLSHAFL